MLPYFSKEAIESLDFNLEGKTAMITGHNLVIDGGFTIK